MSQKVNQNILSVSNHESQNIIQIRIQKNIQNSRQKILEDLHRKHHSCTGE